MSARPLPSEQERLLEVALWLPQPKNPDNAMAQGWNSCIEAIKRQRSKAARVACIECKYWSSLTAADSFGRRPCENPSSQNFLDLTVHTHHCETFVSRHPA